MSAQVNAQVDYQRRAQRHRPDCQHCLRRHALRMAAEGLKPRDIASVLGIHPQMVVRWLQGA